MILCDVNVLVHAARHDSAEHEAFSDWLESVRASEVLAVTDHVLASVVRVTTHARVFPNPGTLEEALAFCRALRSSPRCRVLTPSAGYWSVFERLIVEGRVRGPMVTDAEIAAIAMESGCTLATADRDFARFPGLRWFHPLEDKAITMNPRRS